jgi:hypothetical protein
MGRYHIPAGGLEWDGALPGDRLKAVRQPDGAVVFLPTRGEQSDFDIVIAAAAPDVWVTGSLTLARTAVFKRARATQACAVRLYRSAAARDADLSRDRTTPPTPGSGVLAETWLGGENLRDQWQSPAATLFNADDPSAPTIYWAVLTQMTATLPITVTITALPVET